MKALIGFTAAVLLSQIALAQNVGVDISGCYLNEKESQGTMKSLVKASSGYWGAQYATGKILKVENKLLALPDRKLLDYRVSDQLQERPYGMGTFKVSVDAKEVTLIETVSQPPYGDFNSITHTTVVEAGGKACGKTVSVRTLVKEFGEKRESCEALSSVSTKLCEALVYSKSYRSIARCEGRGTTEDASGKKSFSYKAHLVEDGIGKISTRIFKQSRGGDYSIDVYGPMSFAAELDKQKGLIMHLVAFSNGEWYSGYPLVLDTKTMTTNSVTVDGNAAGGPGNVFDTIQCRFSPEAFVE